MRTLRTPDDRFDNLPGYPFAPHYTEIPDSDGGALRMHHVEDGPADGEVVLCLHGEPSWSYLYRKMLPVFAAAGYRAVAPDLVGFGRSDKPTERSDYTYQRHLDWLRAWFDAAVLSDVTLVCQDWGGLLGLRLAAEHPERFSRIVAANTILPTGDQPPPKAFMAWRKYSQETPDFAVGAIIQRATATELAPEVVAAYDAPFPDDDYKAGARQFPVLVPVAPDDPASQPNREAWAALQRWEKPFLTAFSDSDPIMRGLDQVFLKLVPGTAGQPHTTIESGGHFLQEDQGEALADAVVGFMQRS
ncbi:MAG: haloalkane dehalogenase [bacterium]|nr:haloalkane dehalogenase [bacterium]